MANAINLSNQQVFAQYQKANQQILDVRTAVEWSQGIAQGAHCLSLVDIQTQNPSKLAKLDKNTTYYVMCQTGQRSQIAIAQLQQLGFNKLFHAFEGYKKWQEQGLPTEIPNLDTKAVRYSRHHQLHGFGEKAQEKLTKSSILLIGAGGLGSPAALYLAAAGVGTITLIDDDIVSLSNLQRQVIHTTESIGELKVESAKRQLTALNPEITIQIIAEKINPDNAQALIAKADVIIDGSDNLTTRYLVNDSCCQLNKPLVYAAVFQYEAQITSFDFRQQNSPCLRCLFPQTAGFEPENCSTVGVLGVVPAIAGIMQASEAIKLMTDVGKTLQNKLQIIDLFDNSFRSIKYKKDTNCQHYFQNSNQV